MKEEFKLINDEIMAYALKNDGYSKLAPSMQSKVYKWYNNILTSNYNAETLELGKSIIKGIK